MSYMLVYATQLVDVAISIFFPDVFLSCSWKTVDVTVDIGNDTDMGVVLYDLEPFTKYAVYVQAYSTALSKTSHTSPIVYFVTEPSGKCPPSEFRFRLRSTSCAFLAETVGWLVWRSGNSVDLINKVKLRRARLVLGLVKTFGEYTVPVLYPGRPTQSGHSSMGWCSECWR